MNKIYFDWSIRRGVVAVFGASDEPNYYRDLNELLDSLSEPHEIIGEATFSSFDLAARYALIERCEREGHTLLTTPNRLTGRKRRAMGYTDADKSDEIDVLVIRQLVLDGTHLKRPSLPDAEFAQLRERANAELMNLRRTGSLKPRPRGKGYTFSSAKDEFAEKLIPLLPSYAELSPDFRVALGDGHAYSKVTLAAVGVAARYARSKREFDRLAGLYAHGYPSQIRADLHHYSWAGGNARRRLNGTKEGGIRKRDDLTFSQYRRALRWLYHQLAAPLDAGTLNP